MNETARLATRFASNRSLVRQMNKWGWVKIRTRGDLWRMEYLNGSWVDVKSPDQHSSNDSSVFRAVIDITTGGDIDRFWSDPTREDIKQITAAFTRKASKKKLPTVVHLTQPIGTLPTAPQQEQPPMPEPAKPRKKMEYGTGRGPAAEHRGAMSKVLLALLDMNGRPARTEDIVAVTGYPNGTAGTALARLAQKGLAERLVRGQYRAPDRLLREMTVRHYAEAGAIDAITAHVKQSTESPETPVVAQEPRTAPEAAPVTPEPEIVTEDVELSEDTVEAVLDLLIPGGFKARHLGAVEAWCEATRRLIAEVQR